MAHFPLFIDIQDRKCLVAGGGNVAYRKVKTLLAYGGDVRVVALEAIPELSALLPGGSLKQGLADEEDLSGCALVVAATGSRQENHRIAALCRSMHIPVNVVDCPEECTFLFPAVVRRGEISIGINTGAKSPGLSRHIRERIEEAVPDYYAAVAEQVGEVREDLKENVPEESVRRKILSGMLETAFREGRSLTQDEIMNIMHRHTMTER